jgi:glycosyltransferase involved in cell wall biosynthesis
MERIEGAYRFKGKGHLVVVPLAAEDDGVPVRKFGRDHLRVLHVTQDMSTRTGGPPVVITEACLALARRGVENTVVATDAALMAKAASRERITRRDLPPGAEQLDLRLCRLQPPRRFAFSRPLHQLLKRITPEYDVVHVHTLYLFPHLSAYRAARIHHVPYVVSPHSALDPYLRRQGRIKKEIAWHLWQGADVERASTLHLFAKEELPLVEDIAPAVPRAIVPNGVRWDAYQSLPPASRFRDLHLGGYSGPIVLFLGRIAEKKGIEILIEAFAEVVKQGIEARLVIAGPDNEGTGPALRELVLRNNIEARTSFVGMLRDTEKLAALAAADIWALSSRSEGFSIAVIEALAAGRACLLSPAIFVGADAEREGAAVVCELNAQSFSDAMVDLLTDSKRRIQMGKAARDFARRYDWDVVSEGLEQMYSNAISYSAAHRAGSD